MGYLGDVVDELADAARVLLGRREPRLHGDVRRRAEPLGERAVGEHAHERVGERRRVPGRNEEARHAVLDDVRDPADAAPDDAAAAAERLDDDAAEALRARREHEHGRLVERAATSGVGSDSVQRVCAGRSRDELLRHVAKRPAPDEVERRVRDARRGEAPGLREHVDGLVALEHADEERDGPLGQRHGLRLEERLEIHERRELGRRLDPAARTRPDVYAEIVRTPSLRRSP